MSHDEKLSCDYLATELLGKRDGRPCRDCAFAEGAAVAFGLMAMASAIMSWCPGCENHRLDCACPAMPKRSER